VVQARDQAKQKDAIADAAARYGMFFFYKGSDPIDVQMAGVVKDFSTAHHIALIPVSVDGQVAPTVPDSRPDNGQSQSMHINYFPALFLVEPASREYHPLAYGFMTQDDLAKRFLNISTGFKPNF
jgi:conjugal transfer pilus assembly protein TraF